MELRLQRACNLIVRSEQSLSKIAMASGLNSTSHFSRVFQERFGVAPGAQRTRLS
jgi:transcriptional regulator GlxA family with amidase domain